MDIVLIIGAIILGFLTLVSSCLKTSSIEDDAMDREMLARSKKDEENEK